MTTTSRIRIRAGTPADLDALTELHFDAFEDNVMSPLMYPNGPSEDCKAKFRGQLLPPPAAENDKKKGEPFLYVAELLPEDGLADGLPEIVAMAKGTIYREQRSEEEWKAPLPPITADDFGEGADIAVVNAFIGQLNLRQQELAKGEAALCKYCCFPILSLGHLLIPQSRSWPPWLQAGPATVGRWVSPLKIVRRYRRQSGSPLSPRGLPCGLRAVPEVWIRRCQRGGPPCYRKMGSSQH